MKSWLKIFVRDIYDEICGKKVDHPLIRRGIAFVIDYLLTSAITVGLLILLERMITEAAEVKIITNAFVAITYFSIFNSNLFRGQTIGKLITRIQTVDKNSKLLGFYESLFRSIPVVLLTISYPLLVYIFSVNETVFQLTIVLFIVLTSASVYFPIANHTRQTLQDLLLGTQVINNGESVFVKAKFDSKVFLVYIVAITMILIYMYVL